MDLKEKIEQLSNELESSRKLLTALGDESRQYLILEMLKMGNCNGARAIEIADHTQLSRPAVSHHLQIMKDAGLLKTRKEGTKIYYYFDPDMKTMNTLIEMLNHTIEITKNLPGRSGKE